MGEMPLDLRREKLAMMYWVNLQGSNKNHRTRTILDGNMNSGSRIVGWRMK